MRHEACVLVVIVVAMPLGRERCWSSARALRVQRVLFMGWHALRQFSYWLVWSCQWQYR